MNAENNRNRQRTVLQIKGTTGLHVEAFEEAFAQALGICPVRGGGNLFRLRLLREET